SAGARICKARRRRGARRSGERFGVARPVAGGWAASGRPRSRRDDRARLVRAAGGCAAQRANRHALGACARRRDLLRDDPGRSAPLLAPSEGARVKLVERGYSEKDRQALVSAGVHPLLARLYAARRIASATELRYEPAGLHAPGLMKNLEHGAALLAD